MPGDAWAALDLFWLCYTRFPGMAGWAVQRTGYPGAGTPLEQDNRTMWAFSVIEAEFYSLQADLQAAHGHARELERRHRQIQAEGKRRG